MVEIPDADLIWREIARRNEEIQLYGPRKYGENCLKKAMLEVRSITDGEDELLDALDGLIDTDDISDDCVAGRYLENAALAIGIAFDLGRLTTADRKKAVELANKQRLAGLATGAKRRAEADRWRTPAKQIYFEVRGRFLIDGVKPPSQRRAAQAIVDRLRHLSPPDHDEIKKEYIPKWDQIVRRGEKLV